MTKRNFKIGDKVKVVNMGECFSTYNEFFFDMKDELLETYSLSEVWAMMDNYQNTSLVYDDTECVVLFVGKHRYNEYNDNDCLLLVRNTEDNGIYLILGCGVELLSVEDIGYNYVADEIDKALDIFYDMQKYLLDRNVDCVNDIVYGMCKKTINELIDMQAEALGSAMD